MLSRMKSIYGKILLTIMLCFVLPMSIVFFIGYNRMEDVIMDKIEVLTQRNIGQITTDLQDLCDRVNQTSTYLSSDMRLNELLREYEKSIPVGTEFVFHTGQPQFMEKYDYLKMTVELQNILINYADNWLGTDIEMGIVGNDGHLFATWPEGNTDYGQLGEILERVQKEKSTYFTDIHPSFINYGSNSDYYTYVKVLYDIYSVDSEIGILIVTVPLSEIEQIVVRSMEWEAHDLYIINKENEIVHTFQEKKEQEFFTDITELVPEGMGAVEKNIEDGDGKRFLLRVIPVEGVQWRICCMMPYEEVFGDALILRRYVIGICVTLILLLSVIMLLVIYRLFLPLRALRDSMRQVENGDWNVEPLSSVSNDEIGMLTSGFNRLMKELRNMFEREKESEKQKGELKFEMLLAQINPHFLFNTLNSIKWMAVMIHADNIVGTIHSLARILEISMNRQADILPISEELQNLNSYLEIQRVRYGDLFRVEYDLEEGIGNYQALKLVFQPIVENAVVHNIQEVNPLDIYIQGRNEDGCIVFRIRDNGMGMNEEQVRILLEESSNSRKSIFRGIGLRNVQQRIQMKYGDNYGIQIHSEEGRGTIVEIRFPAVLSESGETEEKHAEGIDRG